MGVLFAAPAAGAAGPAGALVGTGAIAMKVAALAITAASAAASAESQRAAGHFQAAMAQRNADAANRAAKDAIARGQVEEMQQRTRVARMLGSQQVAMASSGVDPQAGSAAGILGDTASLGELDALTIRNNAMREAWGLRSQAAGAAAQGQQALSTATYGAYGSLLSGANSTLAGLYSLGKERKWWGD